MELYHYGVKGMRWGVRRYQNQDGSLTNAGKKRYKATRGDFEKQFLGSNGDKADKMYADVIGADRRLSRTSKHYAKLNQEIDKAYKKIDNDPSYYTKKGWKAKKASEKAIEARKKYQNAKGLSKAAAWVEKTLADDKAQRAAFRETSNNRNYNEYVKKRDERYEAQAKATKGIKEEQAGVILRDLGYEDTKKAREFVAGYFYY